MVQFFKDFVELIGGQMNSGLGRPRIVEQYKSAYDYLNNYVLVVKDTLIQFKEELKIKQKEYNKAKPRAMLQEQKLNSAYEGFEAFRK